MVALLVVLALLATLVLALLAVSILMNVLSATVVALATAHASTLSAHLTVCALLGTKVMVPAAQTSTNVLSTMAVVTPM